LEGGHISIALSNKHEQEQCKMNNATLPETGLLRLRQIIGDPNATPPVPALIPVGRTTWYHGVKSGRFPAPVNMGVRTLLWRAEDIRALIEKA